ncbi:MAG: flagellar protein FlgN [Bacillota bacterium]
MTKSTEQLLIALTREYEMYQEYLELAKKKKTTIIEGNVKELDNITKIEQNMIIGLGKIDQIRTAIVGNVLYEKQVQRVENITELANYLEDTAKEKVLELKEKLTVLLDEIRNVNEINSKLLKQSLEYIDFNLNLVTSINKEPKGSTYGNKADEKKPAESTYVFDAKV